MIPSPPSKWQITTLGSVVTLQRGMDLPHHERLPGPYPVVGSNGVAGYHAEAAARGPGVIVGRSGSVGKVTWVETDYWPLNTSLWVTDFNGNDSEFIFHFLTYLNLGKHTAGVSVPTLNRNVLHPLEVIVPPVPEQRAIARALRAVQQAKETRRREAALERERKAALMEHLLTHGTQPRQAAPQTTRFGSLPHNWKVLTLEQCAFVQTGVAVGRRLGNAQTVTLPYLRVANVQNGFLDLTEMKEITIRASEVERYALRDGDVVLTEGGDFDKLGRGFIWRGQVPSCVHQNHIFAVRADRSVLLPEFLTYLVQSEYGRAYFLSVAHKTTNLACINTAKLKAFPTALPGLEEQQEIVEALDACDAKIAALEREIALLDELFRALLEELMTGRLSAVPLIEAAEGGGP